MLSPSSILETCTRNFLKLPQEFRRTFQNISKKTIKRSLPNLDLGSKLGLISAFLIFSSWIISFILICQVDLASTSIWLIGLVILGRTFLHTGLFIISHDAAHGTVFTPNRRINDLIGAIALTIYGLLPYQKFVINHGLHHKYPATDRDPDFHDGKHPSIIRWYLSFMSCYLDKRQNIILFFGMTFLFHGIRIGFQVPALNLLLFWILPLLLSSMQLFYFGTFLPHRNHSYSNNYVELHLNSHNARSSEFPLLISFLTCYHFGYHWEHHEYPQLPWFELPTARNRV
jgi:beta-carotene/zeaxanthin 4-ketolase